MDRIAAIVMGSLSALLVLSSGGWAVLLLWHRAPAGWGLPAAILFAGFAAVALVGLWRGSWLPMAAYAVVLGALVTWFVSIRPSGDPDWAPDVSRQATAEIGPSVAVVRNVRNFTWRTNDDVDERWEERSYELDALATLDLVNSYWAGPAIAHTLLSFGFRDGRYLVFSIEIRRRRGEEFSNIAGFFKRYELAFVAADERDIVRVRTNVRDEDTQVFRLKVTPEQVRGLFVALLERGNRIAAERSFYNTLLTNCTTEMFGAAREVAPQLPFDWRVILSGYLPDYAYDLGILDRRRSLAELRETGRISARAKAADGDMAFSARIRDGVPDPSK